MYVACRLFLGGSMRGTITTLLSVFFAIGIMLLTPLAYFLRDVSWRIEIALDALPGLLTLLSFPLLLESPRFLVVHGRIDEAAVVLHKMEAMNGAQPVRSPLRPPENKLPSEEGESFLASIKMLTRPSLCVPAITLWFSWFAVTLVYYGLTMNAGAMAGDVYTNTVLLALVEFPGYLACYLLLDCKPLGRRGTQALSFLVAGAALLLLLFPAQDQVHMALMLLGKLGATAAFVVVYILAGELFPTTVRGVGLGICNICARSGGIIAPLMGELPLSLSLLVFGVLAATAGIATLLLVPETLGMTLKDVMDEDMQGVALELADTTPNSIAVREEETEELERLTSEIDLHLDAIDIDTEFELQAKSML